MTAPLPPYSPILDGLEILAFRDDPYRGIRFYMRRPDSEFFVSRMEFEEIAPGSHPPSVCILKMHDAQRLIDSLWECGLRPSEGTGSAGSLAATQHHLTDMRRLVAHYAKTELP